MMYSILVSALGVSLRSSYPNARVRKGLIINSFNFFSRLREEEDLFVNELLNFLTRVVVVLKVS